MKKSRNRLRLNAIELGLSPSDWAIRLIDEVRRYPSNREFLRAVAKGTYREAPYIKPYFALAKQAEAQYPGRRPADIEARHALSRHLRTEFHSFKLLTNGINEEMERKIEMSRLRTRALTYQLQALILRDAFAQTIEKTAGLIERYKAAEPDERDRQLTKELAEVALAAGSSARLFSLARAWADEASAFLIEILRIKAATQVIQEKHFADRLVLYPGTREGLECTLQTIYEIVAVFNEYLSTRPSTLRQNLRPEAPSDGGFSPTASCEEKFEALRLNPDVFKEYVDTHWVKYAVHNWEITAKNKAITEILAETSEHEDFVWDRFCERHGVQR